MPIINITYINSMKIMEWKLILKSVYFLDVIVRTVVVVSSKLFLSSKLNWPILLSFWSTQLIAIASTNWLIIWNLVKQAWSRIKLSTIHLQFKYPSYLLSFSHKIGTDFKFMCMNINFRCTSLALATKRIDQFHIWQKRRLIGNWII